MNTTYTTTNTTTAVHDLVAKLERAWNSADGSAFGAVFTDDADFIDIRGSHHHGRTEIGHGHQAIFDTIYKGSNVQYSVVSATTIGDNAIFGIVAATLDVPSGSLQGVHESRISVLLINEATTGWRVRSFHNTIVEV